ncbi:unnamed protein product [Sphenostylis stenocarpa]|uniref:HP domain-containing protein n=1 Tax=Sphenostylis stenocarpa TaxID=92480 RepID=A0AA86W0X2_9FABA|nr:unnamed protein product [Sphenostylis stenocarpa]
MTALAGGPVGRYMIDTCGSIKLSDANFKLEFRSVSDWFEMRLDLILLNRTLLLSYIDVRDFGDWSDIAGKCLSVLSVVVFSGSSTLDAFVSEAALALDNAFRIVELLLHMTGFTSNGNSPRIIEILHSAVQNLSWMQMTDKMTQDAVFCYAFVFSMRDLDPAFQGAGQKAYPASRLHIVFFTIYQIYLSGLEIWRIENFNPVPVPKSSYGKFFTGDSYVILKTTASKSGALRHDIHYWLGKDTSQDEAGVAAIKTVEMDAALGGRAVQYREVQGHETEKFLSYFKPCIIPQEGGIASGFKHPEAEKHKTRLFVCRGKHVVHVKEVPFARASLNHDDIFVLDTESKIFQFNGSNSSIQERAKALEVVQYIKDTYHDGKCDVAAVEDGKLMADAETGEFWGFFGGFAPLPRKTAGDDDKPTDSHPPKLLCIEKGQAEPVEADPLKRELLDTNKCYILDCGFEVFVWMGRNTTLDERKSASGVADELVSSTDKLKPQIIRVIEGFETVMFRSKFDSWPQTTDVTVSEDGRGKVAALLKRQGVNVKGLLKADPVREEPQPHIDCTGHLQVWRVNGQEKILLQASDQSKFYSGDCYIFQYTYPGEDKEDCLIGTWIGKNSVQEEQASANSLASSMVESMKFLACQARIYEGNEPIQFYSLLQSFIVFKGGLGEGYKTYIAEKEIPDETYNENGVALFRIQGSGPENMQAIQFEPVASSLNSSYCYILHNGPAVFTWSGNSTSAEDQELVERLLDLIKPNLQSKPQREGSESEQFWDLLGGKSEYPSQKILREAESDPHLFCCHFSKGNLKYENLGALLLATMVRIEEGNVTTITSHPQPLHPSPPCMLIPAFLSPILSCHVSIMFEISLSSMMESSNSSYAFGLDRPWIAQDKLLGFISLQCINLKQYFQVTEVYNFSQDDLMTEDIFILDCHLEIFVWVGQQVDSKSRMQALTIGEKFLEHDFLLEKLSRVAPIYVVMEGSEPPFFTRFFKWDSAKSTMLGNSFQRKLTLVKSGGAPLLDKPKRRTPVSYGGRSSSVPDKSQRSSRSMSVSPDRVRVRGRSPAFNALAANFENPNARNLSTPPPVVRKLYPKSVTPDSAILAPKAAAIAALSSSFEQPPPARETMIPRSLKVSPVMPKSNPEKNDKENAVSTRVESLTIQEDVKENEVEDEEGLVIYPYERLKITATDPVTSIDVTKRETYLSSAEFKEKFGMSKDAFYKLPKWKQNKLKMAVQLF